MGRAVGGAGRRRHPGCVTSATPRSRWRFPYALLAGALAVASGTSVAGALAAAGGDRRLPCWPWWRGGLGAARGLAPWSRLGSLMARPAALRS